MTNTKLLWAAAAVVFALAMALSVRPGVNRWRDGQFFYVAGGVWSAGQSPYDYPTFRAEWLRSLPEAYHRLERSFVYPPTVFPVAVVLSALPYAVARALYDLLSIAALVGSALVMGRLVHVRWAGPATLVGLGLTGWQLGTVFLGQTAPFATFGVLLAVSGLVGAARPTHGRAVFGIACASIKPQLTALPLLALVRPRSMRMLLMGALSCLLLAAIPLFIAGTDLPAQLQGSTQRHLAIGFNRKLDRFPLHRYDMVALVPLVVWLASLAYTRLTAGRPASR